MLSGMAEVLIQLIVTEKQVLKSVIADLDGAEYEVANVKKSVTK
jgi:hypothetical protein